MFSTSLPNLRLHIDLYFFLFFFKNKLCSVYLTNLNNGVKFALKRNIKFYFSPIMEAVFP